MKILLTGCTRVMCGFPRKPTSNYLTFFELLAKMLQQLGHTVHWTAVTPGDELKGKYDLALIGLQTLHGMAGKQHKYGAFWAATQLKHMVVFDDWQVYPSCYSLKVPKYLWREAMLAGRELEERAFALQHQELFERVQRAWWSAMPGVLAPLFEWGDHSRFSRTHPGDGIKRLYSVDPSPFVPSLIDPESSYIRNPRLKNRRWVLASLADHGEKTKKLGLTWPIVAQHCISGKRGWGRIGEDQLVQHQYTENWGIISPKYNHAGSGWWRSRFNYAAQTRSILLAHNEEVRALGDAYLLEPQDVEEMSDTELVGLAGMQAASLAAAGLSAERTLIKLDTILLDQFNYDYAI